MYSIHDLTREFGISRDTIGRYVKLGLLPPPIGRTRAARYSEVHVRRLRAIRHVRERNVTLRELRDRFAA